MKLLIAILLSTGLALLAPTVVVAQDHRISDEIFDEAADALQKMMAGQYNEALDILNELLAEKENELSPYDLATVYELRGSVKASLNDLDGARADFQAALDLNVFPPDRQKQLKTFIDQIDNGQPEQAVEPQKVRRPIKTVPPKLPERCLREKGGEVDESVEFLFDISEAGTVENIRVAEATDECFVDAARKALEQWKYEPEVIDGEAVRVVDERTVFTFKFVNN